MSIPLKVILRNLILSTILGLTIFTARVSADSSMEAFLPVESAFQTVAIEQVNGVYLARITINGPPDPPSGTHSNHPPIEINTEMTILKADADSYSLSGVPAFDWSFGCSATSAAMIAGYYDRHGYGNMYSGDTNGGVMPLNNSIWGTYDDGYDDRAQCPLSATRQGLDGMTELGHVDDYWVHYQSSVQDPFITGGWPEHTYGDCTGDFMKTNQSNYSNSDGATSFTYWHPPDNVPFTCQDAQDFEVLDDGTDGFRQFLESRGYTVTECYNQYVDSVVAGGFSLADFVAEINAGRPVMIHVTGHTMVGIGYDLTENKIFIHDTWDYSVHEMPWGGSYKDMELESVSIIHLEELEKVYLPLILSD